MNTNNSHKLPSGPYNHKEHEEQILNYWLTKKMYKPEFNPKSGELMSIEEMKKDKREPWSLICPPPNAYGRPHIGNLSGYAYQDAMARYQRMNGKKVLMIPGKDHAGLEGEGVFVREVLEKKKIRKFDLDRDEFYQMMMEFNQENMKKALKDEQEIGLSADFDRNLFTLDERVVDIVLSTFVKMFEDGMIYKGVRIVNWDPKARSTIADNQCERLEREGTIYNLRYKLANEESYEHYEVDKEGRKTSDVEHRTYIEVATTRPETMFGDTAVAVNPSDERYKDLVGKKVIIPLTDREIPIITSHRVEKDFGTGALKITPAHAIDDFHIMNEWNEANAENEISYINVIGQDIQLHGPVPEKYKGQVYMKVLPDIVKDLEESGALVKQEKLMQNILISERTKAIVEPMMSSQWFVDVERLKEPVMNMVKSGKTKIHPENMEKAFYTWMENLRDWAISRSLWWGYRMPVWYAGRVEERINDEGKIQSVIEIDGKWVELDPMNPEHMRVQIERPEARDKDPDENTKHETPASIATQSFAGRRNSKIILVPGKHGYVYRDIFPEIQNKFDNVEIVQVENLDELEYQFYEKALESTDFSKSDIVVTHSLGARAFIKYILENKFKVSKLIMLAPGARLTTRDNGRDEKYAELITDTEGYDKLHEYIDEIVMIYSDTDELMTTDVFEKFGELVKADKMILEKVKGHYAAQDYSNQSNELIKLLEASSSQLKARGWIQDDNVLDTWFSSGQWPFATLSVFGLMDTFYPTDVMETGFDILENWVSRMMMFSHITQDDIPFKDVYLHGLVKGTDGQKMSKSKGNLVNIDEVREQYGTDAVRMVYFYQNTAGSDYAMTFDKLKNFKQFNNKIWNASKFVLMNLEDMKEEDKSVYYLQESDFKISEVKALYKHIIETKEHITKNINDFEFGLATYNLYQGFWHEFADIHVEALKPFIYTMKDKETGEIISEPKAEDKKEAQQVLLFALKTYLKMLHPFIPFVTETIWNAVPKEGGDHESLLYTKW